MALEQLLEAHKQEAERSGLVAAFKTSKRPVDRLTLPSPFQTGAAAGDRLPYKQVSLSGLIQMTTLGSKN